MNPLWLIEVEEMNDEQRRSEGQSGQAVTAEIMAIEAVVGAVVIVSPVSCVSHLPN